MASSGRITRVQIDAKALEAAAKKGALGAVNSRAAQIQSRVSQMAAGFRTGRYYSRPDRQLRGGKQPEYGIKRAMSRENPHALVYTANYAAMKFEHEHNGLLKASR